MKKKDIFKKRKFVIALHEAIPVGPGHDLKKFFIDMRVDKLVFIAHPLTYLKEFYKDSSRIEIYSKGKSKKKAYSFHWTIPDVLLYGKDVIYTVIWITKQKESYDVFFGVDPLNAFAGIILRKLGKTDKVVYYTIDYFTTRFKNSLLNKAYHAMDKFCVAHADETWNLSPMMEKSRAKYNDMKGEEYQKQRIVPIGVWYHKVKRVPFSRVRKNKIVFIGSFVPMMGVDLIIKAANLIKSKIPTLTIEFIGSGPDFDRLKNFAEEKKILPFSTFHGWVSDRKKLAEIMSTCALGLAPFNPKVITDEIKNADPAKIKDYMLWGMPVVMTNAPSSTNELLQAECVRVIPFDEKALAKEVIMLLKDEKKLKKYRDNALSYVSHFDYEHLFSKNITRVLSQ